MEIRQKMILIPVESLFHVYEWGVKYGEASADKKHLEYSYVGVRDRLERMLDCGEIQALDFAFKLSHSKEKL